MNVTIDIVWVIALAFASGFGTAAIATVVLLLKLASKYATKPKVNNNVGRGSTQKG